MREKKIREKIMQKNTRRVEQLGERKHARRLIEQREPSLDGGRLSFKDGEEGRGKNFKGACYVTNSGKGSRGQKGPGWQNWSSKGLTK